MKSFNIWILFAVIVFQSCSQSKAPAELSIATTAQAPALIPLPQTVSWKEQAYIIPASNTICHTDGAEKSAKWLVELMQQVGSQVSVEQGTDCGNFNLSLDPDLEGQLGQEGYILDVTGQGVKLSAAHDAGLFYGIQTLRQMLPPSIEKESVSDKQVTLHQGHIEDRPKYSWRGTMVDVARSFFGLDYLKQHVDRMALYKLNRLHLHLTDDQGWRIELKSKPALTEIGAKSAVEGGAEGFITQQEYQELQDYALARHIIIIPEIDMPGHIYSALRAYPELNCPGNANLDTEKVTPPAPYTGREVGWSKFCLTKPEVVYDFVGTIIGELADITQGPWIHIGGDEIEDPLYEEFIVKADSIVRATGKTSIGWQEVTQAPVDTSLISQVWREGTESVVDVKKIQSICSRFYFDHANVPGQPGTLNWCKESGVSLEDVYGFRSDDPDVIGVEAPVWTEWVHADTAMDNRFWPRTVAFAEVAWTPESKMDFANFTSRLSAQSPRLNYMGIDYFRSPAVDWDTQNTAEEANSVFEGFLPE